MFDRSVKHLGHPLNFIVRGYDYREVHGGRVIDVWERHRFVWRRAASVILLGRIGYDRLRRPKDESCIQLEFQ